MTERHTCPRRMGEAGPWERVENRDRWSMGHGLVDQQYPGCSFCGSLHPGTFMDLVERGAVVGPTDKSYKVYLHEAVGAERMAERKQQWLEAPTGLAATIRRLLAREGNTEEQIAARLDQEWQKEWEGAVTGPSIGKFYFQHLSEEQKRRFVELYNSGTMVLGYPGHFYARPFFMVPVE